MQVSAVKIHHADIKLLPTKLVPVLAPPNPLQMEVNVPLFATFYSHNKIAYSGFQGASDSIGFCWGNDRNDVALPLIQSDQLLGNVGDFYVEMFYAQLAGGIYSLKQRSVALNVFAENNSQPITGGDPENTLTAVIFFMGCRLQIPI
jgi:hypothetical protein